MVPAGSPDVRAQHHAPPQSHHRDVHGGTARAAVFGLSDGLVSNVSLILGFAGAATSPRLVLLAGLAGLVAGAVSMAAGEYVSMQAQKELFERELDIERRQIALVPDIEEDELRQLYVKRGLSNETASAVAREIMVDPEVALATHAREELGVSPENLGSPVNAAISSFIAFSIGAVVPVLPWFVTEGGLAVALSLVLALMAAVGVGLAVARATGRSPARTAIRQVLIASFAAAVTFAVGKAVGIGIN